MIMQSNGDGKQGGPDLFLPPVFAKYPDLRVVATGRTEEGHPFLKFLNLGEGSVREVAVVYATANKPGSLHYDYSVVDEDGLTTVYSGAYGDPAHDTLQPWGVISR